MYDYKKNVILTSKTHILYVKGRAYRVKAGVVLKNIYRRMIMAYTIKLVKYYYTTVRDQPGEAYRVLSLLAEEGVNQLAFTAIPSGQGSTQLAVFPDDPAKLAHEAKFAGLSLEGPHHAFLIHGDDELGALAEVHQALFEADINIYASSGVSDGKGSYCSLIYVKEEDCKRASETLGI